MKIQAENKAHTPCYPVIAAVAAAMLALPACEAQTQAPQTLRGEPKKVESKEVGKDQRSQQPVMGSMVPPANVRPPQRMPGKKKVTPPKPERPPQGVCGRKKVAPPKQ